MKRAWFRRCGWIYRPVSFPGALVTLLVLAFCVNVFLAVDRHSHSVSDTLYGIFPLAVPAAVMWLWIASKTCGDA